MSGGSASAAPFVRLGEAGKWEIQPEGAQLLQRIEAPIVVVAVAGLYRTGKSFFLNTLAGNTAARAKAGFRVGSTTESCTRGIDVCVPDGDAGQCGRGSLVLLDTEGLASMEQDEAYDAQVFALSLLLSSYFVLNSMGVIDEAAVDRLYLIGELSKHISVSAAAAEGPAGGGGGAAELASFFPPFLWLLRDFVVDMRDADGQPLAPDAYMERALEPRPSTARRAAERNETRAAIRDLFPSRSCATLARQAEAAGGLWSASLHARSCEQVRPAAEEADVRRAIGLEASQLRPQFVEGMSALKQRILGTAPPKALLGEPLDGSMLVALARQYTAAMNTEGVVPSIRGAWESVVEERCRAAADGALAAARRRLADVASSTPPPDAGEWADGACAAIVAGLEEFDARAVGGAAAAAARTELQSDLCEEAARARREAWRASLESATRAADAAAAALPAVSGDTDAAAAATAMLDGAEAAADGPCAAFTTTIAARNHLLPWLARAGAAAAAERAAAAAAAERELTGRVALRGARVRCGARVTARVCSAL